MLKPGKVTDMMSNLKALESEHHRAVLLCHTTSTSESIQEVQKKLDSLTELLQGHEKTLKNVEAGVGQLVSHDDLATLT